MIEEHQMGDGLLTALEGYFQLAECPGPVPVEGIRPDICDISERIGEPPIGWDLFAVEHHRVVRPPRKQLGISKLIASEGRTFEFPDFSRHVTKPSDNDVSNAFERVVESPPRDAITYYVGPPLTGDFDSLLVPGDDLGGIDIPVRLPGIQDIYWHAGDKDSGTAFHCEDGPLRSYNLTLYGWKLWLIVRNESSSRFEEFIKSQKAPKNGPCMNCDQEIRHKSLLVTPERLKAEGVTFDQFCTGPGDLIITGPRQYHAVLNLTTCFAIAINFTLPGELARMFGMSLCQQAGLSSIPKPAPRAPTSTYGLRTQRPLQRQGRVTPERRAPLRKRKGIMAQTSRAAKAQRTALSDTPREGVQHPKEPLKTDKAADFIQMVQHSLSGISGLQCLAKIIRAWRSHDTTEVNLLYRLNSASESTYLRKITDFISAAAPKKDLSLLLHDFAQLMFARHIREHYGGQIRLDWPVVLKGQGIYYSNGAKISKAQTEELRQWRKRGDRLLMLPEGILCVVPHTVLCKFVNLDERDANAVCGWLDLFLRTTEYQGMLKAGTDILRSLWEGRDIPERVWEAEEFLHGVSFGDQCSEKPWGHMLQLLAPFPYMTGCEYSSESWPRGTPRPSGWPDDCERPDDPATGFGFEAHSAADGCPVTCCTCADTLIPGPQLPDNLRLRSCDLQGTGVVARGSCGAVVIRKGDILGELSGELLPADEVRDSKLYFKVRRRDIGGEPVACQVYTGRRGSWARRVRHRSSGTPTAYLEARIYSGSIRVLLVADADLVNGEEVSVL